ncbi:MAG: type II secretion system F family protein [Burkholderiaceae bacterium]
MKQGENHQETALLLAHLSAGVNDRESLPDLVDSLARSAGSRDQEGRWSAVAKALRDGDSIGVSLREWPTLRQVSDGDWLDQAEAEGALSQALGFLAGDLQWQARETQRRLQYWLWPALILGVAVVVAVVASIHVIPALRAALDDLGLAVPESTSVYFGQGPWVLGLPPVAVLLPLLALVTVLWLALSRSPWLDRLFRLFRLDAGRWDLAVQLRLLPLLAQPDSGRLWHHKVLQYVSRSVPIPGIRARLMQTQNHMEGGQTLMEAATASGLIPPHVVAHLGVADKTGNVAAILDLLSTQLHDQWLVANAKLETRLNFLVYLVSAYLAFQLLIAMYLPIFQLGQAI